MFDKTGLKLTRNDNKLVRLLNQELNEYGSFEMFPNWVPRAFCTPGRRIRLDPRDYYIMGPLRGGLDERWFNSTTPADNGKVTWKYEGLSAIVVGNQLVLLKDAVSHMQSRIIGKRLWNKYGRWPTYTKFFDNLRALPHHVHHREQHARQTGQAGKPEAYYFSPDMNNYDGEFAYTFFGITPGTPKVQVQEALHKMASGVTENGLRLLAQAYQLLVGTGWDVPAGILHAPGSLCTYEPQFASDVFAMYEGLTGKDVVPPELLWKDCPDSRKGDESWLMEILDWKENVNPNFKGDHYMVPVPVKGIGEMEEDGFREMWVCYKSRAFSATELTILPGRTATLQDGAAYGMYVTNGDVVMQVGDMKERHIGTQNGIRFRERTHDEIYIPEREARWGVTFTNPSLTTPCRILKNFAADNPDIRGLYNQINDQNLKIQRTVILT